ncbi:MAG: hypothetical protein ACI9UA_003898 [Pseudoalteromonas tetraodonis]|jgi:hypothetical protein
MQQLIPRLLLCYSLLLGGVFAQEENKKEQVKRPVKIEGDEYRFGDIFFNKKTREIRFAAEVIQDEVVLEYAIVHALIGKVHESLLATEIRPIDLQIVMKLLRYKDSQRDIWAEYDENGEVSKPMQDDGKGRVEFYITTKDEDGKKKTVPLSDWIEHRQGEEGEERSEMPAGRFTYTGSGLWEGRFIAEGEGAFAAIYRYSGAMFNSFQPESDNDDIWFPRDGVVPPIGTKVEVSLKPLPDEKPSAGWKEPAKELKSKTEPQPSK